MNPIELYGRIVPLILLAIVALTIRRMIK